MNPVAEIIVNTLSAREFAVGDFARIRAGAMSFRFFGYEADGVGSVSYMEGSAMPGLMKMTSVIVTPSCVDAPLFSYDRIHAALNDTLLFEVYDTYVDRAGAPSLFALSSAAEKFARMREYPLGSRWYDSLRLPCSVAKNAKGMSADADAAALEYARAYLDILRASPAVDRDAKTAQNDRYVNGLIENGGTSTDAFVKAIGKEKTRALFREVLFKGI